MQFYGVRRHCDCPTAAHEGCSCYCWWPSGSKRLVASDAGSPPLHCCGYVSPQPGSMLQARGARCARSGERLGCGLPAPALKQELCFGHGLYHWLLASNLVMRAAWLHKLVRACASRLFSPLLCFRLWPACLMLFGRSAVSGCCLGDHIALPQLLCSTCVASSGSACTSQRSVFVRCWTDRPCVFRRRCRVCAAPTALCWALRCWRSLGGPP